MSFYWCVQSKTTSPIVWEESFRKVELKGSPVLEQAREREAAILAEWGSIASAIEAQEGGATGVLGTFTERSFLETFTVVLANSIYLASAQCFAILPIASAIRRTGNNNGCDIDYDEGALTHHDSS